MSFLSRNAFTGQTVFNLPYNTRAEISIKIRKLQSYLHHTAKQNSNSKISSLHTIYNAFLTNRFKLSELISIETGKPYTQSLAEVNQVIALTKYYHQNLTSLTKPKLIPNPDAKKCGYRMEPLGNNFIIGSYNAPLFSIWKYALPNILIGNNVLIRPDQWTPLLGMAIQEILSKKNLECVEFIFSDETDLEYILESPEICGVGFTGSTESGNTIAKMAGKNLKPAMMELSTSNAMVILGDADLGQSLGNFFKLIEQKIFWLNPW